MQVLRKLNISIDEIEEKLQSVLQKQPTTTGGDALIPQSSKNLALALSRVTTYLSLFKDEFVNAEHLFLSILTEVIMFLRYLGVLELRNKSS